MRLLVISDPLARHLAVLERLPQETTITTSDKLEGLADAAPQADVILNCTPRGDLLREIFLRAPKVRWIHSLSAGVEMQLFPELLASDIPLTNGRGVYARSLAEFALAAMLFFAKDLRRMVRQQEAARWEQFDVDMLQGRTLGIVGFGEIGRLTAEKARAFDMKIAAVRRRPAESNPLVDRFYPLGELPAMLSIADYVLIGTPLTPETRGLIGARELAAMQPRAVLINVARGPVVDEAALLDALAHGRIRGAALDVFSEEPLPATHPFWRLDNVLLSPHTADHTATWLEEAMEFFVGNFERFAGGQPLRNIVDKSLGY